MKSVVKGYNLICDIFNIILNYNSFPISQSNDRIGNHLNALDYQRIEIQFLAVQLCQPNHIYSYLFVNKGYE